MPLRPKDAQSISYRLDMVARDLSDIAMEIAQDESAYVQKLERMSQFLSKLGSYLRVNGVLPPEPVETPKIEQIPAKNLLQLPRKR